MNLKSVSVRLSKKDVEILQSLCAAYGETATNIVKHALHFLHGHQEKEIKNAPKNSDSATK